MTLKNPLDMHLHLRSGKMLQKVTPFSAKAFRAAVIMPNLIPPITTKKALLSYKKEVLKASKDKNFTPLMTLFYQNYEPSFLQDIRNEIFALKLYPAGITTNSASGISNFDIQALTPTLEAMSELEIPLLIHGESNDFVLDRESNFAPIYATLAKAFPKLKIVMEHITTKTLCDLLKDHENLYATITLHHLLITLDDVIGGKLNPHLFCKPIAKRKEDKEALLELALSGYEKVMFGSDSAPHPRSQKECCGCAAGVFSAPVILPVLAELFAKHSNEANLQKFISDNAVKIHNLHFKKDKTIKLIKKPWQVSEKYGSVVPFMALETLSYQVKM